MKNPFTQLTNKFTQTFDNVRQTIFRQRKKDEGTKKETHRGKGGGGTSKAVPSSVTDSTLNSSKLTYQKSYRVKSVLVRRQRNKVAARSRRINRLKRQHGKAA